MRLLINANEKRFINVEGETISGVLITIDTNHDLNASLAALAADEITISSTMDGKKVKAVIPKMSLLDLYAIVFANNEELCKKTFQTARGFGINSCYQLPFHFDTPMNLKNGEGLFIECNNAVLEPLTDTILTIETIPTIGVRMFEPSYEMIELEATKSVHDLILDNNVSKVIYLGNNDEVSPYDVEEVTVYSDKINAEYTDSLVYAQLLNSVEPDTTYLGTPIYLLDGQQILNKLRLKLKFSNAIAGRKLIVVRNVVTPQILSNLISKQNQHSSENIAGVRSNN